jgi:hypothetical protein
VVGVVGVVEARAAALRVAAAGLLLLVVGLRAARLDRVALAQLVLLVLPPRLAVTGLRLEATAARGPVVAAPERGRAALSLFLPRPLPLSRAPAPPPLSRWAVGT